ncbi:helix-turn-helix domain-containing protein [Pyramidobacter piscolens]|uniref:helix-turn-helix domain-containing protein n=1 Tax=Pyramidobacter piscolens TaxID=638849 RepID=UPI002AB12114|nr:helix-turn-helix transcriptional regulator [Pyramidobacter piscolens]
MENLKQRRLNLGFTQAKLAELSGLSIDSIRRYEHEERVPRAHDLKILASVLRTTPNELLGVDEKSPGE